MKIQLEFDKDTANRLLSEAFDIISEIKDIIDDQFLTEEEALEEINDLIRNKK